MTEALGFPHKFPSLNQIDWLLVSCKLEPNVRLEFLTQFIPSLPRKDKQKERVRD